MAGLLDYIGGGGLLGPLGQLDPRGVESLKALFASGVPMAGVPPSFDSRFGTPGEYAAATSPSMAGVQWGYSGGQPALMNPQGAFPDPLSGPRAFGRGTTPEPTEPTTAYAGVAGTRPKQDLSGLPMQMPGIELGGRTQAMPPPITGMPQSPGFGERLMAGLQSFGNSGALFPAIANAIGGLVTGQRQDPTGIALQLQGQSQGAFYTALRQAGVSHQDALAATLNPELGKLISEQAYPKPEFKAIEPNQTAGFVTPPGLGQQGAGTFRTLQQGGPKFDDVAGVRKEVTALPEVKRYSEALPSFRSMVESQKKDTRAADLDFIYGMAKIFDPDSVVREGEMKISQATGSLGEQLSGIYKSVFMGESRLTKEVRQRLLEVAQNRINELKTSVDTRVEPYKGIAERNKMNWADIAPQFPEMPKVEATKPTTTEVQPKNGQVIVNPKTGERRVWNGKEWIKMKPPAPAPGFI